MRGLRLAVTTFTVWPVKGPDEVDRASAGAAMRLAPLVSLLVSLPAALLLLGFWILLVGRHTVCASIPYRVADYGTEDYGSCVQHLQVSGQHHPLAASVAAVLAVASTAALTRGLHLDGLADTVDGLGSYRSPEKALELMKRGGSGPFGVAAVVVNLLLQIGTLAVVTDISPTLGAVTLVVAVAAGRVAVTLACTPRTPAARPDGLGAMVAGTVTRVQALGLTATATGLSAVVAFVPELLLGSPDRFGYRGTVSSAVTLQIGSTPTLPKPPTPVAVAPSALQAAVVLVVAVVLALAVSHALRAHCVRRFGGMTGDVLGALVEVTTGVVLLVTALVVPSLS